MSEAEMTYTITTPKGKFELETDKAIVTKCDKVPEWVGKPLADILLDPKNKFFYGKSDIETKR